MGPRVWGIGFRASGFEDLVFGPQSLAPRVYGLSELYIF